LDKIEDDGRQCRRTGRKVNVKISQPICTIGVALRQSGLTQGRALLILTHQVQAVSVREKDSFMRMVAVNAKER
jgi:hypothetical protein